MNRLDLNNVALVKKGFGCRWEFSAVVGPRDGMSWRVLFPIKSMPGYTSNRKYANLVKRGINELRRVVVGGEPIPGYWSIYAI